MNLDLGTWRVVRGTRFVDVRPGLVLAARLEDDVFGLWMDLIQLVAVAPREVTFTPKGPVRGSFRFSGGREIEVEVAAGMTPQDLRAALDEWEVASDGPPAPLLSRYIDAEVTLAKVTNKWTVPVVVRDYKNDESGRSRFRQEVGIAGLHGYVPVTQTEDGGHIHAGRLLLTGGLSIFVGKQGIRSDGSISVTFQRTTQPAVVTAGPAPASGAEIIVLLEKLGQLRDSGVLSEAEFEAKKADLLSRL